MFELLGNETKHEATVKRIMNIQEEMIENFYRINDLKTELEHLKKENENLDDALIYWYEEAKNYYKALPTNLITDLTGASLMETVPTEKNKKKPTTKK